MSDAVPFLDFLRARLDAGGFPTEDALGALLPLFRQAARAHEAGRTAPFDGLDRIFVTGTAAWYREADEKPPLRNLEAVEALDRPASRALEVVGESRRVEEVAESAGAVVNLFVGKAGEVPTRPVYLPGYRAWEHAAGHHDALTDTFSLGLMLASVACGLDFTDPAQLERFASARSNLFLLRPDLHPVVAKAIVRMTELSRHRRAQDLPAVLRRLENYRDPGLERETDPRELKGFRESDRRGRRQLVLSRLRDRLFEISRRNRLLYFRPSLQSVNLTWGSVPLMVDVRNVRAESLFTWQGEVAKLLSSAAPIPLEKYLRFEDAPYLREVLDRILSEAKRDQAEYGFAQLRLVLCFLRWHNLKEDKNERIDSPLLLLPVRATKRKGVRDSYLLEPLGTEAEVNPVLRHQLKQLYGIEVPESVDLQETSLDAFHARLSALITASEPGVTLNKVDRPRIELVYDRARRRLDQYRRRLRLSGGQGVRSWEDVDYSYQAENFQPLGLRLFQLRVRPSPAALRSTLQDAPVRRVFAVPEKEAVAEKEKAVAEFQVDGGPTNPYSWDFDLCSLTLGNFKYRKMSLVQDYETLLEQDVASGPFDSVFSLVPRPVDEARPAPPGLEDQFPVVACDPTQTSAVHLARTGRSFIIQGPPGTGKSQTITNLIADYVARGKHVLFVCEKRAALDVVYHRLKQSGLADLCSRVHDSQQDKKAFIQDLKATYDAFIAASDAGADPEARRLQAVEALKAELEPLRQFDERMRAEPPSAGLRLCDLLHRRLGLDDQVPDLAPVDLERIPEYGLWRRHAEALERLKEAVRDAQADGVFRSHPLSALSSAVAREERPIETVMRRVAEARAALDALEQGGFFRPGETLQAARRRADAARLLVPLAERDLLSLLDGGSAPAKAFAAAAKAQETRKAALEEALKGTAHWTDKLPPEETADALEQARALDRAFLAFLRPSWWRLRKALRARYAFSAHAIVPSWTRVLEALAREHAARAAYEKGEAEFRSAFRAEGESAAFAAQVRRIQAQAPPREPQATAESILACARQEPVLAGLERGLGAFLDGAEAMTAAGLRAELDRIERSIDRLPAWLPCLADVGRLPEGLGRALRREAFTLAELEAAMAERSVRDALRSDRFLAGFGGRSRDRQARRLEERYGGWLKANAEAVRERVRRTFAAHVRTSSASASTLSPEEKALKARYSGGRRDLEHEFEKTMRYKSVRTLLQKESGDVILDLKPIWLMSPLSVSDTLPLDAAHFDVVIFDEASQIPLEDAIPSVHRASQIIVVGDEMQLPPTSFFAARRGDDDEEGLLIEEAGEVVEYDLESDSFLNHACRNLGSTMLGWHYRSRSEALISFSNAAFYEGGLLTVPDRRAEGAGADDIVARSAADGAAHLDRLLDKSLSFHYLEASPYENRRNPGEAAYIAQLVRSLLARGTGLSVGVIAFSEAQQDEIEGALAALAKDDAAFRERLEAEYDREEDGQFVGLLVKNLENIQGDERDVVILSVCYGPDASGRMLMNFGPINQSGGEKRLNVAFSRAKRHMAVVSSIRSERVTNDYNDGARCLKNYLRYAEAVSRGDAAVARRILRDEVGPRDRARDDYRPEAVVAQAAEALRAMGYETAVGVGQSRFRCDLAVKKPGEPFHRVALLVDTPVYFEQRDLLERELLRPRVLKAFDWRVFHLLAKDWYADRAGVLSRLSDLLEGREEAAEPVPPLPPPERASEAPALMTAPVPTAEPRRRFECVEDGSSKFWEVWVEGPAMTVRFGRIGTEGQTRTKTFADAAEARREADALIREKLGKRYREKAV